MRALLSLAACLLFINAQAQLPSIKLNPIEQRLDSAKHYHKILIVGEGNMQAHMFLDYLSAQLIKGFKKQDIECKYEYLGDKAKVDTRAALEKAKAWPHDAVLQFHPIATTYEYFSLYPNDNQTRRHLENDFDISLLENKNIIWFSRLSVEMLFDKLTVFKRIRQLILADMVRQNVLPH